MHMLDIEFDDHAAVSHEAALPRHALAPFRISMVGDPEDLGSTLLTLRALRAFDIDARRYPIYRLVRAAARGPLEELFDSLAQRTGLAAHRLEEASLPAGVVGRPLNFTVRRRA